MIPSFHGARTPTGFICGPGIGLVLILGSPYPIRWGEDRLTAFAMAYDFIVGMFHCLDVGKQKSPTGVIGEALHCFPYYALNYTLFFELFIKNRHTPLQTIIIIAHISPAGA